MSADLYNLASGVSSACVMLILLIIYLEYVNNSQFRNGLVLTTYVLIAALLVVYLNKP